MSHPDPGASPDTRPIEPGEVWDNPVTLERGVLVELPWLNNEGRAVAELTALPGARVAGEHLHPALHETFSVQEGELTVLRDGRRSVLRAGERAEIEQGIWHDWWNEGDVDAIVRVEITPVERFVHMIRNAVRARPRRTCQQARDAAPTPARALRHRVLRRDRVPQTTSCGSARCVRRAHADRPPPRLSRDLPLTVENDARPAPAPRRSRGLNGSAGKTDSPGEGRRTPARPRMLPRPRWRSSRPRSLRR
jgi:quercetin dioxygenase-like cupin family protein